MTLKEHTRILELAEARRLPQTVGSTSQLDLEVFEELYDAGFIKAVDASSMDGRAWLEPRITNVGRRYLEELRHESASNNGEAKSGQRAQETRLAIFVSHSSEDIDVVKHLVELFQSSLRLRSNSIRCTSLDGYRLPAGVDTDSTLRAEVHEARAFIGLISERSLGSLYVAFELGARWAAERPMIPLLAGGLSASGLGAPLNRFNALTCGSEEQLHQLVRDVANALETDPEPPDAYRKHIVAIMSASEAMVNSRSVPEEEGARGDLPDAQVRILLAISQEGDYNLNSAEIARKIGENATRTEYHIERLQARDLVTFSGTLDGALNFGLTHEGRAFLVERQLV